MSIRILDCGLIIRRPEGEGAKKVVQLKGKVAKQKCSDKTKRNRITTFICGEKSRHEFQPLIGLFVDQAHIEPLHPKNNSCRQLFRRILYESIAKSALSPNVKHFDDVPHSAPFYKHVDCLQKTAKLARLAKEVKRWFNETKGSGKDFQYRFTVQESRMFLHNFMFLIDSLSEPCDNEKHSFTLHVFAYICLQLRQSVSVFCRVVNVTLKDIDLLRQYCTKMFSSMLFIYIFNFAYNLECRSSYCCSCFRYLWEIPFRTKCCLNGG